MTRHLRRFGAFYILTAAWIITSLLYLAAETAAQTSQARQHGQPFQWSELWPQFWSGYFENVQSEYLQLATAGLLMTIFASQVWRVAIDQMDRMEARQVRIEAKLDTLVQRSDPGNPGQTLG